MVGYPHDIKGQGIYCYRHPDERPRTFRGAAHRAAHWVRTEIGPIASPDLIQWAPGLPKTRSGKIMRPILRKIAGKRLRILGDTSTLAEPAVVDDLIDNRMIGGEM